MGEEPGKWKVGEILAEVWNLGPSGSALSPIQIGRIYRYNTDIVVPLHATVMGVDELFQRPGGVS
ncbi:MAG TPA: hypothetical protein PLA94_09775, partial [Myxococcota bacterium]|nr:hypothetical protein [Myxococcota bacterium]